MKNLLAPALLALTLATPAAADLLENKVSLEVLPGWKTADGTQVAALRLTLAEGWKTYWRAPGDSGIPPQFQWDEDSNIGAVSITWPTPLVIDQNGIRSIGYKHAVTLPIVIRPRDTATPVRLSGQIQIGICNQICVPVDLAFDTELPAKTGEATGEILRALADRPRTAAEAGVRSATCRLTPTKDGLTLHAEVKMPSAGGSEFTIIESSDPMVWVEEATSTRSGDTLVIDTALSHSSGGAFAVDRSALRMTILGARHAVDIQGCNGA